MTSLDKYAPTSEELEFAQASIPIREYKKESIHPSKYTPTEEEMEFAESSMKEPLKEEVPWYSSYRNSLNKGTIKGLISFGESFGGLKQTPQEKIQNETKREELLEQALPSNEGFIEGALERGGKMVPYAAQTVATGGLGIIPTTIASGTSAISGESAKKLGFGETGQAIAETIPQLIPALGSKIVTSKANKQLVEEARRLGLSEKEIAPLIQGDTKQKLLSKFAERGRGTQNILKDSKKAVGNLFETLEESAAGKTFLSNESKEKFLKELEKPFSKITDEVLNKIKPDYEKLLKSDMTGSDLVNFWQKLNKYISKGNTELGTLKGPLSNAINSISPEFKKDFEIINTLYQNSAKIRSSLRPKDEHIILKFLSATAPYRMLAGITTGYYPILIESVGEVAARKLTTKMLTNPRIQNLGKQILQATADRKTQFAKNLSDILKNELEEIPEAEALIDYIDLSNQDNSDKHQ